MTTVRRKNTEKITDSIGDIQLDGVKSAHHTGTGKNDTVTLHRQDYFYKLISVIQYDRLIFKYDIVVNFRYKVV